MRRRYFLTVCLLCICPALAQQRGSEKIIQDLEKERCATLESSRVTICQYDYQVDNRAVEALSFEPAGERPFPAVLMIPGYQRTARALIPRAARLAAEGFACIAVTQPGFGKSGGPPDFVGAQTIKVLTGGYRKFQREPFAEAQRMGIYGYSRGAMAASLLVLE